MVALHMQKHKIWVSSFLSCYLGASTGYIMTIFMCIWEVIVCFFFVLTFDLSSLEDLGFVS